MGRLDRLPRRVLDDGLVVHEATTLRSRLLGLAFMRSLPPGHALLIPHCRSVHTFGMRVRTRRDFPRCRGPPAAGRACRAAAAGDIRAARVRRARDALTTVAR